MTSRTVSQLSSGEPIRVLLNGHVPDADGLRHPALINYGHFTAMQARGGRVRGLQLHLDRIATSHRELFGSRIDESVVLSYLRIALDQMPDCYLRATLFEVEPGELSVMTVQRPPSSPSTELISLMPVEYQQPIAHVKHVGSFGKIYYATKAQREGFDEALHTSADGWISETTGSNIGFLDGARIVWPAEPALRGITWSLLETAFEREGIESVREPINVRDVSGFSAAFLSNSIGIAPVGRIGSTELGDPFPIVELLTGLYESTPWDDV